MVGFALILPLVALLLIPACTSTRNVRRMVTEANLASLSPELGLGAINPERASGADTSWQEVSRRIQAFVDAHPNDKATIASLRLRQALMLLHNKQFNLAQATFSEVVRSDLHESRDKALQDLRADLLWWYKIADGRIPADELPVAVAAQNRIQAVRATLGNRADAPVADWLAIWQAWIGLKAANDEQDNPQTRRSYLTNAVNRFATSLPAGETAAWLTATNWPPDNIKESDLFGGSLRRHLRADTLVLGARTAIESNEIPVLTNDIADPYFRRGLFQRP